MSLRHALLGLLVEKPASGYELTRMFEQTLDQFAWQARHSQIYPELNRLTRDGLIEVIAEGARGRKTYATTEAGRAEFTEWMMRPPEGGVRNEFILRLYLVSSLEHDRAVELLRRYADDSHTQLGAIGKYLQEHEQDRETDPLDYGHLAADYGLRLLKATNEWAEAALARINRMTGVS